MAIAAIACAPALVWAQGGSSGGGQSGSGSTSGGQSSGGATATNQPRTRAQAKHDSLVNRLRNQRDTNRVKFDTATGEVVGDTGTATRDTMRPPTRRDTLYQVDTMSRRDTTDTTSRDTTYRSDTTMRRDTIMRDTTDTTMRDTTMRDTTMGDTTMRTDTMMRDTTMRRDTTMPPRDTTMRRGDTTYQSSAGELYTPPRRSRGRFNNYGLSTDQVKQLQQAINDAGCHAGPVDGRIGHETRQGIQCVRQKNNITGKSLNDVVQSLNLGFTVPSNATGSDTTGAMTGTQKNNHRTPMTDSTSKSRTWNRKPPTRVQRHTYDSTSSQTKRDSARDTTGTSH
jgi:hypothetical protein